MFHSRPVGEVIPRQSVTSLVDATQRAGLTHINEGSLDKWRAPIGATNSEVGYGPMDR